MAKKITGYIKLQVPAGEARPAPPVGPVLGQRGLNIMEFCKSFNAATQNLQQGMPIPCVITVYADRSFSFETKSPPASYLIKRAAKVEKGASLTGRDAAIGKVTMADLREIAELKAKDLNCDDAEAACRMLAGSARSMGIEVVGG